MNKQEEMSETKGWKSLFSPNVVLMIDLFFVVLLVGAGALFLRYPEGDIIEHIHASFLVSQGKVPYVDFFEHHNPLMWYLFSPVVELFFGDIRVFGAVAFITYLVFLVGLWFLYKIIVEFLGDKTAGLLSVIVILLPGVWLYYLYFKPDNYMLVMLVIGIYYLFSYMRDMLRKDLIISFTSFGISFLFLQKVLLFVPSIGLVVLYLLYKKQMKLKDFLIATVFLLATVGLGVLWLIYEGCFDIYLKSSFEFNRQLVKHIGEYGILNPTDTDKFVFYMGICFGAFLCCFKDKYFRIWYFISVTNLACKLFYFSPHLYYFYEAYFFVTVLMMVSIVEMAKKNKLLLWVFIAYLQVYAGIILYYILFDLFVAKDKDFHKWLVSQTNRCDYVFTSSSNGNLFYKDLGYYWFLRGQLDVVGEKTGIAVRDDYNKLIEEKLPKVMVVYDVYDRYKKFEGIDEVIHKFDWDMIYRYYDRISEDEENVFNKEDYVVVKGGLFKLKKEFEKTNCQYNEDKKEWLYEEN